MITLRIKEKSLDNGRALGVVSVLRPELPTDTREKDTMKVRTEHHPRHKVHRLLLDGKVVVEAATEVDVVLQAKEHGIRFRDMLWHQPVDLATRCDQCGRTWDQPFAIDWYRDPNAS